MTTEIQFQVDPATVFDFTRNNLNGLIIVATKFAATTDSTPSEFWKYVGRQFAPQWQIFDAGVRASARNIAQIIATNMITNGANILDIKGDEYAAELRFTDWPDEQGLALYTDVTRDDVDTMLDIFNPIAAYLGLEYTWERQGVELICNVWLP